MEGRAHKIVFLYLLISLSWILVSDYLVYVLAKVTTIDSMVLQTGKGFFFVAATALMLFGAIKKQQRNLVKTAEQYQGLFYYNPNPLWIYDRNTLKFVEVNNAAVAVYGYSREEFKSMTILDIRPEEERKKLKELMASFSGPYNTSTYWRHIKKSGETLIVNITSHKMKFDNRDCSMVLAKDVTNEIEHKERLEQAYRVEKELREQLEVNIAMLKQSLESKKKLAEVVDRINNMVIITDPYGVIVWVNQSFENFTGYKLNEVIGKTSHFLHGPETNRKTQQQIMESIQTNDFSTFEILNYTKQGEEYWVELSISAIRDENGVIVRYISIHNVITDRKLRENKIKEQNEILRKHSWTNSHALRKPVASILSLVSLSRDMEKIEEIKEIHSLIEVSSLELDDVVRRLSKELNACEA